jgi:hypothetical protein
LLLLSSDIYRTKKSLSASDVLELESQNTSSCCPLARVVPSLFVILLTSFSDSKCSRVEMLLHKGECSWVGPSQLPLLMVSSLLWLSLSHTSWIWCRSVRVNAFEARLLDSGHFLLSVNCIRLGRLLAESGRVDTWGCPPWISALHTRRGFAPKLTCNWPRRWTKIHQLQLIDLYK